MGFFDDLFSDDNDDKKEKKQKKKRKHEEDDSDNDKGFFSSIFDDDDDEKIEFDQRNRTGRIRSRSLTKMIRRMMTAKDFSPVFSTMMTTRK